LDTISAASKQDHASRRFVSVVETCRRLKIPIREYLCSILPGLANFPINRTAELTRTSWLVRI